MRTRVYPLEFVQQGGMWMPKDPALHQMAAQFADANMGGVPNFVAYARVYVACELNANDEVEKVVGLSCIRLVPDVEQMRYLNAKAAHALIGRMHDYLRDQGAAQGSDVFVRIADGDDPFRCDRYLDWLKSEKAVPAERWKLPLR